MAEPEEDVVAVCGECKTDQPEHYIENSPFAQMGAPIPCRFCGGVVFLTYRHLRDQAIADSDRQRGL